MAKKYKLCWETTICWRISLEQAGSDNFAVQYGAERHEGLRYAQAAQELGRMLLHALSCENKVDNREKIRT